MSLLQKIIGALLLAMMAGSSVLLTHLKAHQHLGEPGIKTQAIAGKINRDLLVPENLPGYTSEILTNNENSLQGFLPDDSSYRLLAYRAKDGFLVELSVVLMGGDRT